MKLGIVMDPISGIQPAKDSSLAMLLAAQKRDWQLYYMELPDLHLCDDRLFASLRTLSVHDDRECWYRLGARQTLPAEALDVILMRKDPPVDMAYIHATHLLARAEVSGVRVYNKPRALREISEKLFTGAFGEFMPPTLVSRDRGWLQEFAGRHPQVILKPLDAMGGSGVFCSSARDANFNVIVETLTENGSRHIMAQQYLPAIKQGDKRILLIAGEPVGHVLARIPGRGDPRGNLARGAKAAGRALSASDRRICARVGPVLRELGVLFCGLDVIGEHLTEINVTSPTCIRELDACFGLDIASQLLDAIEADAQETRKQT